MASKLDVPSNDVSSAPIVERVNAIRDRWHTKRHPFFNEFSEGRLPLKALGRYQALHYHFVSYALPSFGLFYARAYKFEDVRKMMAENLAEEEGFKAIPQEGHEPHDHNELMFRFCRAAGLGEAEVRNMKMTPAWWARSLYYYNTAAVETGRRRPGDADNAGRPDARAHWRGAAARLRETLRLQTNRE
jgi:pyrroloquinoline quinone (PQQ) biosynthesis protein C